MSNLDTALSQLKKFGTPEEALALLELMEEKRKKENFIRFWEPYQGKFGGQKKVFDIFRPGVKELYVLGGNRSGKTVVGAAIAMAFLMGKEFFRGEPAWEWVKDLPIPEGRPRNIWVVGLDFSVVEDVIWKEKLLTGKGQPPFLPKNFEEMGGTIRAGIHQLVAPDGSTLTCKSADSGRDKFQGASIDLVWIDEECDVSVYDECYQRTIDCAGFILVTLTPLTDTASGAKVPWVFNRVREGKEGNPDIKVATLSFLDNPFVPETEKDRAIKKWRGHVEERARLYGDFIQRSGLVYPMLRRDVHFVRPEAPSRDLYRVACIDPAPTGPTACLWATIRLNDSSNQLPGDITFTQEYKVSNEVVSEHAKNILAMNGGKPVDMWFIDPVGGNQRNPETHKTIAQLYRENGIPVRFPNLDEDFGRDVLAEYFNASLDKTSRQAKAYIADNLKQLEDELFGYVWDFYARGEKKGLSKEKPLKRNDHLINCAQYIAGMRLRGKRARYSDLTEEQRRKMALNNSYT